MRTILFVTSNENKFREVKSYLEKAGIHLERSILEIVEKQYATEREVSLNKALSAAKILNRPVLVEDTGVYFSAFKSFPGPYAKQVFENIGIDGILKLLDGKNREAVMRTSFAYCEPGGMPVAFTGEVSGKIAERPSEVISFAYDTLFVPEDESKTFSEMSVGEKERYSHRIRALQEFLNWWKSLNQPKE